MIDYNLGKIYTVRCMGDEIPIYVGSTANSLSARLSGHKQDKNCSLYKYIHQHYNGCWDNWYIELYEAFPAKNKEELNQLEGEIIRLIGTINKRIAGRKPKEFYLDNREDRLKYQRQYDSEHKEEKLKYQIKRRELELCSCGCMITTEYLNRHKKTKKHLSENK